MGKEKEYDVIIIGGGITGAGTARDCAMRGLRTLLLEKGDMATGATGRNHGLLHSGARYAVDDPQSAAECIRENLILKKIAPHCIEDTKGLFVTLPQDADAGYGLDYQARFVDGCRKAGIDACVIDPKKARELEPAVNPDLTGAVLVPDASVDPFRLCASNMLDARMRGADILLYHEITHLLMEGDTVVGVRAFDKATSTAVEFRSRVVVNAAGVWGAAIVSKAGARLSVLPSKGALLVFGHRVNNVVLNKCRKSSDADILVPADPVSIIGTTSSIAAPEEFDNLKVTPAEVDLLLRESISLCPQLATTRIIRAYAGVRPLVCEDGAGSSGRNVSRGISCIDHERRDGVKGLVTIAGGKLTTYRLMARMATDAVCSKLGVEAPCLTASNLLPDPLLPFRKAGNDRFACSCERVTEAQVIHAVKDLGARNLEDLRRRTRAGMGTCQGTFCIGNLSKMLAQAQGHPEMAGQLSLDYLNERWKGMMPVGWGDTLREMEFMQRVYKEGRPYSYEI